MLSLPGSADSRLDLLCTAPCQMPAMASQACPQRKLRTRLALEKSEKCTDDD